MKNYHVLFIALVALNISSPAFAHEGEHSKASTSHSAKVAAGKSLTLKLSGLHCAGCAMSVQSKLLKVPGVAAATVNAKSQSATVTLLKGAKRPADTSLKAAVKAAGYTCSAVKG